MKAFLRAVLLLTEPPAAPGRPPKTPHVVPEINMHGPLHQKGAVHQLQADTEAQSAHFKATPQVITTPASLSLRVGARPLPGRAANMGVCFATHFITLIVVLPPATSSCALLVS
jgi:hypothetical protein